MPIHPIDVILHKRDGLSLTDREIEAFVEAVVTAEASDAQIASLLMAIFQRGLDARELATLTRAMRFSGEVFARPEGSPYRIDKHSTGGVGDKTSLLIAPIVAAAGLAVPMISGRSLGHTGGTLDKLETIPGFSTQFPVAEFSRILDTCGLAMAGQTPQLVPADRILYALRDHTGTVESPFLITASIMSKKLAEDLDGLVLDVKVGSGAFLPSYAAAKQLAELMVQTGEASGTRTVALLTAMDEPLGRFAGNWLEVRECVDILQGRRHPLSGDLLELSLALAGWMLYLGGKTGSVEAGVELADALLTSGAAWRAWLAMVAAQHGDPAVFDDLAGTHRARATRTLDAAAGGYFQSIDCRAAGWAVQRLGAGRLAPGGPVSAAAGIEMHVKLGDRVEAGQRLVTLYADDAMKLDEPYRMLRDAIRIGPERVMRGSIVREVVTASAAGV